MSSTSRLVIAPNWIGDAVMSLPVLRSIRRRHPQDRLAVLARRGPAAIYRAEGSADTTILRSSLLSDAAALRRERFEEAWVLPNSFRAALLALLSGARQRIGYATDRRGLLLTDALPPAPGAVHQLRDYDALLAAHGIEPDTGPPRLPISEAAREKATTALAQAALAGAGRLALLAPGSAFARTKRWPPERYAGLADALAARGYEPTVVIGPAERDLGARVAARARKPPPVLGADLDPVELAALLSRASVLVSNDSGPMHLAGAVGTPVVALFGPTDPGRTAPSGSPCRVLDRYVFCSPCFLTKCPYGHECMKEITVEDAVRAVEDLTGAKRG